MEVNHVHEDSTSSERLESPSRVQFGAPYIEAVEKKRRIHVAVRDESRLRADSGVGDSLVR